MHNQPREPQPCEDCQAKSIQEFGYSCLQRRLTWAKENHCCPVVQSPLFRWEQVLYFIWKPRVQRKGGEAHIPSCLKSSVKFPQYVMIWGAMWSAGVGPLGFLKTKVTAPFTKTFWSTSCFLLLTSFLKMLISFSFHFPAGFGTCPHCQKHQKLVKWPWCWCVWLASKLTRPEPHRESIVKRKMRNKRPKKCRWAEGHCQRNLGFHITSAVPQTDHLHATPNWGSN